MDRPHDSGFSARLHSVSYDRFEGLLDSDLLHAVVIMTFMRLAGIAGSRLVMTV
jgi:hypothetical protein